jgi:hypothetical protein
MFLAFAVRMIAYRWMDYTNFPEFYRDYYMVSHMANFSQIPLLGPPSMLHGYHFGPFYYYSMLPFFLLFWGQAFGLIFTGIIFYVLGVYAFFKVLLAWFNNRAAALTGALFMGLSIYGLHLTSYTSNPNFLPLFVLWYFYYLTKVLINNLSVSSRPSVSAPEREWRDPSTRPQMHSDSVGMTNYKNYIYLGLSFGLATQLHATAMLILPLVTLVALIVHKYNPELKTFGIFFATLIFTYLPYLFYEFTHGFANFNRLFILGTRELSGQHLTSGFLAIWNFFQGTLTPFNYWYSYSIIEPNILYLAVSIFAAWATVALIYSILKKQKPVQTDFKISGIGLTIILAWTFFTCVTLLLFDRGVHDHYIIILWPVPMILLTYAVFWLKSKFNVFTSLMALIVVISLLQIYSFYNIKHTFWSGFLPIYESQYQNSPNVSEIGS